jgi:hypothetical protein
MAYHSKSGNIPFYKYVQRERRPQGKEKTKYFNKEAKVI